MELMKQNEERHLPASLDDLAKYVLIGRDKLAMVRAGIRALDKLDVAEGVRQQKREEAQMLAEALLDAEVRIGEILARMPKASGKQEARGNRYISRESNTAVTSSKTENEYVTKDEAIKQLGFDKMQVSRFQTLAANKDLVEEVKREARENDDLPTRTAVLELAKHRDKVEAFESKAAPELMPAEDQQLIDRMKQGETVVINLDRNFHAVKFARESGRLFYVNRMSEWGNPYHLGKDGNRDEVCDAYAQYFKYKKSLNAKIGELKGKALACHCYPLRCHGDHLKSLSDEN